MEEKQMSRYDDIINLPHHVSPTRQRMSMHDRAAQFAPFSALTGYEESIVEAGRLTEERRELSETEQTELNRRINFLAKSLKSNPEADIIYFVPDERKSGGEYQSVTGMIKTISLPERIITLNSGQAIRLDDILDISGAIFSEMAESPQMK